MGRDAGPGAAFRWNKVKNGVREGRYWAVGGKYGCAQLHAFTAFYHLFLAVNVTSTKGPEITTAQRSSEDQTWAKADGRFAGCGKRCAGKRDEVGKGGQKVGGWTGFSRLFPDNSMQVVDFPHKATVTLFGEPGFYRGDTETQSQEEERDRMNNDYRHNGRNGRARPIRRFRILVAIFETEGAAKCA